MLSNPKHYRQNFGSANIELGMTIIHMGNRTPPIEVEYLKSIICSDETNFSEDNISHLCQCLFFIDCEEPDILDAQFFEEDKCCTLVSFPYIRRWFRIFFDEFSFSRIDNGSCLEKRITGIYE